MTQKISLSALAAAGAFFLLAAAGLFPSGKLALCAAAGVFAALPAMRGGTRFGLLAWLAASVLSLLLLPDKFICLCFALFLGAYPAVKPRLDGLNRALSWAIKIAAVNAAAFAVYFIAGLFFTPPDIPLALPLLFLLLNAVFVAYDFGLARLNFFIKKRLTWFFR